MNIAFIPVRGGSKSIPLKNIREINGKPLVYWTAKAANDAQCIDKVIIATDSSEVKKVVQGFGLSKLEIFDRNEENASDTASTESVMLEYLAKAGLNNEDNFFLIQATSPMLKSEHIDGMYRKFIESGADSIFSGVIEKQFKWKLVQGLGNMSIETDKEVDMRLVNSNLSAEQNVTYVVPVNYDYQNRPRRQDFEGLVAETGACYINTVGNIKRDKCRLSGKITFYELPSYTAYELDEESDWIIVEELMKIYS